MLVFGHAGITLGAAALVARISGNSNNALNQRESFLARLSGFVDVRLLIIGALLPDIIDKPVGHYFFRETFNNGRIFSHTLLFFLILAVSGLFIYRYSHRKWMLVLAAGTLSHLVLDAMWMTPGTLFWPVLGLEFERIELESWFGDIIASLTSNPGIYIPEIIGFVILAWFGLTVLFRRRLGVFIRRGNIPDESRINVSR